MGWTVSVSGKTGSHGVVSYNTLHKECMRAGELLQELLTAKVEPNFL